jgi:hypothetical protein
VLAPTPPLWSEQRLFRSGTPQHKRTDRQLCSQNPYELAAQGIDEIAVSHSPTTFSGDFPAQHNLDSIEA